ncbi:hypothetical protein HZA57_08855 [Candidatus Poribacteria bacterium]|nr:hypothetical protein [Candidatus Poribacteria bacterium]
MLLDRFEIVRPLGRGGMGEVWHSRGQRLVVQRALKFVSGDLAAGRGATNVIEGSGRLPP